MKKFNILIAVLLVVVLTFMMLTQENENQKKIDYDNQNRKIHVRKFFCSNCHESQSAVPTQRIGFDNLKKRLIRWNQDFMLLLIQKYKEYERNGFITTDSILKFTSKTKEENDVFKQYLDEKTEQCDKHIHTGTLYDDFKYWLACDITYR